MKIAVCDDDLQELAGICTLIGEYRCVKHGDITYKAFDNPIELAECISNGAYFDMILLDIIMPIQNGIETAREIRKYDKNVKIIFLTSSSEYAVDSYGVGAYYYALKPVNQDNLFLLLENVITELRKQEDSIVIKCKTGISRIRLSKLCYCEVINKSIYYYLSDNTVLKSYGSFTDLDTHLAGFQNFIKPHRSYIVNMAYIDSISANEIIMESKTKIPLSKLKANEIKNAYLSFPFLGREE
ncbi:LytTR family DNA-binding domain-containing protein [Anaerocolumna sp. AGMB13025]|uniref:LytR/AlgR family response regulator transcription factor n=1 Tax=Anaerocolumna sp. AGMB13025 TaxID=3039116 RepID=UPI00241DD1E6|nr:LytTR family DNA-binding domain-containing protein [Anaerocolumna sp. AGMB13025]WFR57340.1 LytTR family DNA-binding domain-containing protein [Anaerocolumna sp. AGMB13025]